MNLESAARIRPMRPADVERVVEIAQSLADAAHWPVSLYLAALSPQPVLPRICLVAEEGQSGTVAGFVVAALTPPEAELESIAVAAEVQRQGVARALFEALGAELRRTGVTEVMLEVRASNEAALGLYRSLHFAEVGCRPRYYADPVEDAVLMRLGLT